MAQQPWPHLSFAFVLSCCSLSMGVYPAMVREGYASMVLRTLVSFFLLGIVALYVISMLLPSLQLSQGIIFWGVLLATGLVFVSRWVFLKVVDTAELKRRVLVYGAGDRAKRSEEHTSELQSRGHSVCRLLL